MSVLSIRQLPAARHTRRAIRQAVFARHNFPAEAATLTVSLHTALELLLSEEDDSGATRMVDLINECQAWSSDEKNVAHWIRMQRNKVLHEGQLGSENHERVLGDLRQGIRQLGKLWSRQLPELATTFCDYEIDVLCGRMVSWEIEVSYLADTAIRYVDTDPKAAVEISNEAFILAAHGFALGWGVDDPGSVEIDELIRMLDSIGDDRAHLTLYDSLDNSATNYKVFAGDHLPWFVPPMDLNAILDATGIHDDPRRPARTYTREIRDVIISYPARVPYQHLKSCLVGNWQTIQDKLASLDPPIVLPDIDAESAQDLVILPDTTVSLPGRDEDTPLGGVTLSDILNDHQLRKFKNVLQELCGPLPADVNF